MKTLFTYSALLLILAPASRADEITEWNQLTLQAAVAGGSSPLFQTREVAIVQASVYDAVNGIAHRYTPIRVSPAAPAGASMRAAAVQAAYASLLKLYPAQQLTFDIRRAISLSAIASDSNADSSGAITDGVKW